MLNFDVFKLDAVLRKNIDYLNVVDFCVSKIFEDRLAYVQIIQEKLLKWSRLRIISEMKSLI